MLWMGIWVHPYSRITSVVYRFLPPPLAGIGKYKPKLPSVFGISVSVLLWVFLTVRFSGNNFWRFCGNSFFENLAGVPFVPQKEGEVYKRGPKPPPFLWEKGAPANFKIPNLPTEFPFGIVFGMKIPRKYQRVHTEIPNLYNSTSYIGRWGWILGKMGYGWACMMLRCHGWGCKPPLTASHIHIGCIQSVLAAWDAVDGHMGTHLCCITCAGGGEF